jgi:hypothetical protein
MSAISLPRTDTERDGSRRGNRLEQELAALRLQYANLERNGRVAKRFSALMLVVVAGLLGYLLWTDFVKGALFLVMAVAIGAYAWFARRDFRWIDAGTPIGEFEFGASQAKKVEQWIADREGRLAGLRSANSSGDTGMHL